MAWSNLPDFVAMGGYGLYVWGSYGLAVLALGWEGLMLAQRRRRALDEVRDWHLLAQEAHAAPR